MWDWRRGDKGLRGEGGAIGPGWRSFGPPDAQVRGSTAGRAGQEAEPTAQPERSAAAESGHRQKKKKTVKTGKIPHNAPFSKLA